MTENCDYKVIDKPVCRLGHIVNCDKCVCRTTAIQDEMDVWKQSSITMHRTYARLAREGGNNG